MENSEKKVKTAMKADLILQSNTVFTGLTDTADSAAIVIKEGRIVFVGSPKDAKNMFDPQTPVKHYGDAFISAGLHDSHMHVFHSSLYNSPFALSYRGESEADCVRALTPLAARRPAGSWLLSQGWREYRWKIPRLPSKHSLDAAYPNQPVAMYSGDAHTLWLNSCALRELGIHKESIPPEGGSYDRDSSGELTGIIRETAAMELMPRIISSFTDEELSAIYQCFLNSLSQMGITSICDLALMPYPGLDFIRDDIYRRLESSGNLPLRVHLFPTLTKDLSRYEHLQKVLTGEMIKVSGLKQFFDGVSSQHTAYLAQPYSNAHYSDDRGHLSIPFEEMRALIIGAAENGYPVRIHTIGDEAIHLALDIFDEVQTEYGLLRQGQHCLEHLENLQPDDIDRLVKLDILAAAQPPHITLDPGGPERDLGPDRVPYMWPFKTFLTKGVKLAFGTDSPVVSPNPFDVLYAAITRQDPQSHLPKGGWLPQEKITAAQALRAYTLGSAQAAGRAHELGTLEAGKLADIAVFDKNLLTIDPEELRETKTLATYVGGKPVYDR